MKLPAVRLHSGYLLPADKAVTRNSNDYDHVEIRFPDYIHSNAVADITLKIFSKLIYRLKT